MDNIRAYMTNCMSTLTMVGEILSKRNSSKYLFRARMGTWGLMDGATPSSLFSDSNINMFWGEIQQTQR